ncbi:MAG: hypothetical protein AAB592_00110, partial [Patescibacteria group bacterium]
MDTPEPVQKSHGFLIFIVTAVIFLSVGFAAGIFLYGTNPLVDLPADSDQKDTETAEAGDEDKDEDVDNTNDVGGSSSVLPGLIQDDGLVQWIAPKKLSNLGLLHTEDYDEPDYYSVGTFVDGKYDGGEVILVLAYPNTMSFGGDIFRFVRKDGKYTLLGKHSSEMFDVSYPPDPNKQNLYDFFDGDYDISSLVLPEKIRGPEAGQVIYRDSYANAVFSERFEGAKPKKVFTDHKSGDVYTDDTNAGGG